MLIMKDKYLNNIIKLRNVTIMNMKTNCIVFKLQAKMAIEKIGDSIVIEERNSETLFFKARHYVSYHPDLIVIIKEIDPKEKTHENNSIKQCALNASDIFMAYAGWGSGGEALNTEGGDKS